MESHRPGYHALGSRRNHHRVADADSTVTAISNITLAPAVVVASVAAGPAHGGGGGGFELWSILLLAALLVGGRRAGRPAKI